MKMSRKMLIAWNRTLRMWEWIATVYDYTRNVWYFKRQWLDENHVGRIEGDCFLCNAIEPDSNCEVCPLTFLLDSMEECGCQNGFVDYEEDPIGFYSFLVALDEKAREMKLIP